MKTKNKIISVFLAMALILSSATAAFAKTTWDDILFDLSTLGIMKGDDDGDFQLDKEITRAEFSAITVRLLNMENAANSLSAPSRFSDVPEDHWAKNSIELLCSLNVINGTSNTTFGPNDSINVSAVSKILVNSLGYNLVAESAGGYPAGYMTQANTLGLLDGVDTAEEPFTRKQVARMIYNALDIDIMSITSTGSNGDKTYEAVKGNTFRNKIKNNPSNSNTNLKKYTGIVTATVDAYLNAPRANMEDNEIEINDVLYRIADTSAKKFLGQAVDYYVDDDTNTIVNIIASYKNELTSTRIQDLSQVSDTRIYYYTDKTEEVKKSVSRHAGTTLVRNNRVIADWESNDLMNMGRGSLKFIDNNDDDVIDIILAKTYQSVIVDTVTDTQIYFQDNQTLLGKKYINIDPDENPDKRITISLDDGSEIKLEDVKKDDVLTAYVSDDSTYIELAITQKTFEGDLGGVDKDTVTIDGETYDTETIQTEITGLLGDTVQVFVNSEGEVAYVKKTSSVSDYGYIADVYTSTDGTTQNVKLVLPDTMSERKIEQENADGGESTFISKLACRNKEVINLAVSDKVTIDGARADMKTFAQTMKGQTIAYETNSDNQLNRIILPEQIGTDKDKKYNSYERTFGGVFGVGEQTKTICIPKDNPNPDKKDYLVDVEMTNGQDYTVVAFDKDKTTNTADLIVVTMSMKAGTEGIANTKSKVGIVNKVSQVANEDGEIDYKINFLTEGKESIFTLAEVIVDNPSFETLDKGYLIQYSLNPDNEIDAYLVLSKLSRNMPIGLLNNRGDYETFAGFIDNIEFNEVSEELNRWVHILNCVEAEGEPIKREYEVTRTNTPPIFIYEASTGTARVADLRELNAGSDLIFVSAANNVVRAVVAIR